jgi:hypothetical protein
MAEVGVEFLQRQAVRRRVIRLTFKGAFGLDEKCQFLPA